MGLNLRSCTSVGISMESCMDRASKSYSDLAGVARCGVSFILLHRTGLRLLVRAGEGLLGGRLQAISRDGLCAKTIKGSRAPLPESFINHFVANRQASHSNYSHHNHWVWPHIVHPLYKVLLVQSGCRFWFLCLWRWFFHRFLDR